MGKNLFEHFITSWEKNFYTVPLLIISQFIIIFIYFKYKNKFFIYFLSYAFTGILLFSIEDIINYFYKTNKHERHLIREIFNSLFAIVEIIAFRNFYFKIIKTEKIKNIIPIFSILFITLFIGFLLFFLSGKITGSEINGLFNKLAFFELIFWGLLGVFYYFELFKFYSEENLLENSSFWIVSFSLSYTLIFPILFLLIDLLRIEQVEIFLVFTSLHYFSLFFVYIGIIKAQLCDIRQNS